MKKISHIFILIVSVLLSISLVEAGTPSSSLVSGEFHEREWVEEEEGEKEDSKYSNEKVENCKNSIDGGNSTELSSINTTLSQEIYCTGNFTFERVLSTNFEQIPLTSEELFILYCCLKLNL